MEVTCEKNKPSATETNKYIGKELGAIYLVGKGPLRAKWNKGPGFSKSRHLLPGNIIDT